MEACSSFCPDPKRGIPEAAARRTKIFSEAITQYANEREFASSIGAGSMTPQSHLGL